VSGLQTVNDRFESARIQGRANGEGPQTTQLSRSPWLLRTAGVGHEERFPPTRLNAGYVLRKETIAGVRLDGRDAPIPNLPPLAAERGGLTHGERSLGLLRSRNPTFAGFSPPAHPTTLISQA